MIHQMDSHLSPLTAVPTHALNTSSVKAVPTLALAASSVKASNPENDPDSDLEWWEHAAVAASRYNDSPASFTNGRWLNFSLLYSDNNQGTVPCQSLANGFQGALISIGPKTDAVIDWFGLNDSLVPHLRVLTSNICSSYWESILRTPHWGLSYEQATNLAKAIQADISGHQNQDLQVFLLFSMNFSRWLTYWASSLCCLV
jgi:hypothetical protein